MEPPEFGFAAFPALLSLSRGLARMPKFGTNQEALRKQNLTFFRTSPSPPPSRPGTTFCTIHASSLLYKAKRNRPEALERAPLPTRRSRRRAGLSLRAGKQRLFAFILRAQRRREASGAGADKAPPRDPRRRRARPRAEPGGGVGWGGMRWDGMGGAGGRARRHIQPRNPSPAPFPQDFQLAKAPSCTKRGSGRRGGSCAAGPAPGAHRGAMLREVPTPSALKTHFLKIN